ncbi:hypothetical protein QTP70_030167 [Hemibagrus guttatus]|uniref:Uncharacterized protein n=1 Tax=Hemibagrus guttatus TaxID=175788 RepID=A0AAE0Q9C8_9TELE|nr:hypothetical protein QTP70_030167 [Hemibagrus guttatus]
MRRPTWSRLGIWRTGARGTTCTKQERNYQTPLINESPVERVDSFRYLGAHITQDLS